MTEEEKQSIVSAVLSALQTNSKTIEQLTPVTTLGDSDYFEVNNGRKISYSILRSLIASMSTDDKSSLVSMIEKNVLKSVSFAVTASTATLSVKSVGKEVTATVPVATDSTSGIITSTDLVKLRAAYTSANSASTEASAANKAAQEAKTQSGANKTAIEGLKEMAINPNSIKYVSDDKGVTMSFQLSGKTQLSVLPIISTDSEAKEDSTNPIQSQAVYALFNKASRTIALTDIDTLDNFGTCGIYQVIDGFSVGVLVVSTDQMRHGINQILIGNNRYDEEGKLDVHHKDGEMTIIHRYMPITHGADGMEMKVWTKWEEYVEPKIENLTEAFDTKLAPRMHINANVVLGSDEAQTLEGILTLTNGTAYNGYKVPGMVMTYLTEEGWKSSQWKGGNWKDLNSWESYGGSASVGNCYNVTNEVPISGYYDLESAVSTAFAKGKAMEGMQITFSIAKGSWKTYQYVGASTDETAFKTLDNWIDGAGLSAGTETLLNVNSLCGACSSASYYTLSYAIAAIKAKQETSGIVYAKSGLVITYESGENVWETKQFQGQASDFGEVALWKDFGGAGSKVETKDVPEENGKDAFSTGGAYELLPTNMVVDTSNEGIVKLYLINAKGDMVGDEQQFQVGTGTGGGGTIISINYEESPLYVPANTETIIKASIRSVTTSGKQEVMNSIESAVLIDRDTNQVLANYKLNKASSADIDTFDFLFDVSSYFEKAVQKKFKIEVTDDSGNTGSKNINVTAVDVTATSVQTLNFTSSTVVNEGGSTKAIPMYKFANNSSDKGIECKTEIFVNGEWKELGKAIVMDTYSHSVTIDPNNCCGEELTHGVYPIRIHGVDVASGVEGNYIHTSVMCVGDSTDVLVATRWISDTDPAQVKLYENISFDFAVYDPARTEAEAKVLIDGVEVSNVSALRNKTYTFKKKVIDKAYDGSVTIKTKVMSGLVSSQEASFKVVGTLLEISDVAGDTLNLDFTARSNSEADHTIEDRGHVMTVNGSNWTTNGFVKDSFGTATYGTDMDEGVMSLRIAENVTANLDYLPFNDNAIEQNGMAIQFRMRKRNMAEDTAILMECMSAGFGFYVNGKNVVFSTDGASSSTSDDVTSMPHTIVSALKDDSVTNVAIVIEPAALAPYAGIGVVKMYFDGEEIGACYYDRGTLSKHDKSISFDGTKGELYIYNIKCWKTYYSFEQSFNSYLLKMSDTDAMIEEYKYNQVMASQTAENVTINRPQASALYERGIPYFVLCKNADTDDNEAKDNYPEYLEGLDGDKKTKKTLDLYFYFPDRPWQDFKAIGAVVTNQGTTSSKRPIKNIKAKLKTAKVTLLRSRDEFVGDDLVKYNLCSANAAKHKVQVYEDSVPTNIITIKVDYSESGGANNCACMQLANELQKALGTSFTTPAQNAYTGPYNLNTSIDGIPIAMFRTDRYNGATNACNPSYGYFHAKGNYNQDKGDAVVFGFEDVTGYNSQCLNYGDFVEIVADKGQSVEAKKNSLDMSEWGPAMPRIITEFCGPKYIVLRNDKSGSLQTVEQVADAVEVDMDASSFKSAFNFDDYNADAVFHTNDGQYLQYKGGQWVDTTGKMSYNAQAKSWSVSGDVLNPVENYELLKYDALDWFQGVNTVEDMLREDGSPLWTEYFESRYPDNDDLNALYEEGKKVPYQLFRWLKFCQDCNHHLTEANGNITLNGSSVSGTKENRLKKWKQELHTIANVNSVAFYHVFSDYLACVDQRSKNMMIGFYLDTDGVVRMYLNHWYDGDTLLGSDNDCGLTIPAEMDPNADSAELAYYQGWDSVLFQQTKNSSELWTDKNGNSITVAGIAEKMRECTLKNGLKPFSPSGIEKYWITDRLSKWPKLVSSFDGERKYINASTENANYFYALHGLSIQRLRAYVATRFAFRDGFYRCGDLYNSMMSMRCTGTNITIKIKAAKAGYFGVGVDRANVATDGAYLQAGEEYTLKTNMTNTGTGTMLYIFGANKIEELDISNATPSGQSWDISELVLLKKFVIGGESYVPTTNSLGYLTVLNLGNMPFLEYIDVRNTKITQIKATYCPRLVEVYAKGCQLQSISLAETSPIETLQLPDTMTNLSFINLPNLFYDGKNESGLTIEGYSNVNRLMFKGCNKIDAWQLLKSVIEGGSLKYIYYNVSVAATSRLLNILKDNQCIGLDADGNAYDESGKCSGLYGKWQMLELLSDSELGDLQKYFPNLSILNSQYTTIMFDDTVDDPANITNLSNETGYAYSNDYEPSDHISAIWEAMTPVTATYEKSDGKLHCKRLSLDDYTKLRDGSDFDYQDGAGKGADAFMIMPHFWYKGINDFKNERKYLLYSFQEEKPATNAVSTKKQLLKEVLFREQVAVYTNNEDTTIDGENIISTTVAMNVYKVDVEGMKQVRWPGVNNVNIGAVFVDADGNVISKFQMSIGSTLFDFVDGEYLYTDVPGGAKYFYFSAYRNYDAVREVYVTDCADLEAIEPEWVEHKPDACGLYQASVDSLYRLRSVSRATVKVGNGKTGTSAWVYDSEGKPTQTPSAVNNYTQKDFQNLAAIRGGGYQLIDYEMSKDYANLFYALIGNRDAQLICGYGKTPGGTTGSWDDSGKINSDRDEGKSGNKVLGVESFFGCTIEWMDNVALNIPTYKEFLANKSNTSTTYVINHIWHIYDPVTKTERTVQGINGSGSCIGRVKFGKYADVIASKLTTDSSKYNLNYCDASTYTADRGRVVGRSYYNSGAYGGVAYASASNASSYSYSYFGSRLAFRGEITIDE